LKEKQLATWKEKRKVMQSYDITAEMYEERYGDEQQRKHKKALEEVNVSGKALLDVGCGSGLFFREVSKDAMIVVGVDISPKLLLKAKEQARTFPNASVLQADADHLPFKKECFDDVFGFTVIQNMPKPNETLKELRRVVKPVGRVVITGLKKAFPNEKFMDILENSGLQVTTFVDDKDVNCYIAVLAA
jgi:phosphatidylethanolamine/phosphatidyl-N-methylethanolamine N-methyltransferase